MSTHDTSEGMMVYREYCTMLPAMVTLLIISMLIAPALSQDVCGIELPRAGGATGLCYSKPEIVAEMDFDFVEEPYQLCSCYDFTVTAQGVVFTAKLAKRGPGFNLCGGRPSIVIQNSTKVLALALPGCQMKSSNTSYLPLRSAGQLSPGTKIRKMCTDYDSLDATDFEELNRRVTGEPSVCTEALTTTPTIPGNSGYVLAPMIGVFIGLIAVPILLTK